MLTEVLMQHHVAECSASRAKNTDDVEIGSSRIFPSHPVCFGFSYSNSNSLHRIARALRQVSGGMIGPDLAKSLRQQLCGLRSAWRAYPLLTNILHFGVSL
jgi:hypothetical protein